FLARCASCHRFGGEGLMAGPDLAAERVIGKERLLHAIAEPSAEITPGFSTYVMETKSGEVRYGLKRDENPETITFLQPYGTEAVWPYANISSLEEQPWSLMPAGLETGLAPQAVADLLEYILPTPR